VCRICVLYGIVQNTRATNQETNDMQIRKYGSSVSPT